MSRTMRSRECLQALGFEKLVVRARGGAKGLGDANNRKGFGRPEVYAGRVGSDWTRQPERRAAAADSRTEGVGGVVVRDTRLVSACDKGAPGLGLVHLQEGCSCGLTFRAHLGERHAARVPAGPLGAAQGEMATAAWPAVLVGGVAVAQWKRRTAAPPGGRRPFRDDAGACWRKVCTVVLVATVVGLCLSCHRAAGPVCGQGIRLRYHAKGGPQDVQNCCDGIRGRLSRVGIRGVRVLSSESGQILVEIPAGEGKQADLIKRLCDPSGGRLTFHIVEEIDTGSVEPKFVLGELPESTAEVLEAGGLDRSEIEREMAGPPGIGVETDDRTRRSEDLEAQVDGKVRLKTIRAELERLQKEKRYVEAGEKRPEVALEDLGVLFCPELLRKEGTHELERDAATGRLIVETWHVLHNDAQKKIDASHVVEVAYATAEAGSRPGLAIRFDAEGAVRLRELTQSNEGRRMAAVLDGIVLAVATIHGEIVDGRTHVMPGAVPEWELRTWCASLNAGPLPCELVLEAEEVIPEVPK